MSAPRKAKVRPAAGPAPSAENAPGKVTPKTKPPPKQAPTNPNKAQYTEELHDYLDDVETPEQLKSEWARLQTAKAGAAQAGDGLGMTAAKDALAGLQDKAVKMGLSVKDLPNIALSPEQAMALGEAWASTGNALDKVAMRGLRRWLATRQAKTNGGGFTPGTARNTTGKCGEWQAKRDLETQGYEVVSVQNGSGQGIDVIGRNPQTGEVRALEVKATVTDTAPPITGAAKDLGGEKFVEKRLYDAAKREGRYKNIPKEVQDNAKKAQKWLEDAMERGIKPSYEKYDVFVEDPEKGCIQRKPSQSNPWPAKPSTTPKPPPRSRR